MAVPCCSLCCRLLPGAGERRVLHSASTVPVWSVLCRTATELFPGNVETVFPCKSYLCKPCVRGVEKLIKLKEDVLREEQQLREKVTRAGEGKALTVTTRRQDSDEGAEGDS